MKKRKIKVSWRKFHKRVITVTILSEDSLLDTIGQDAYDALLKSEAGKT